MHKSTVIETERFSGCRHFEHLLKVGKIKPLQTVIMVSDHQQYSVDGDGRLVSTEEGASQMSFDPSGILEQADFWSIVS